ncbi:MAG: chemotaxis protein [Desulfovibrio aminophilus]|uniref:chemotaxis protein n=1 Tax=Desulfovibrio aminophilus TaxID=81425 RepID=UPI0039EB87B2
MAKKTEILLETGTNELEILEFHIDEQTPAGPVPCHFGVNVAKVMQVIESPRLTHPESATHASFLGVIPLRDHILPVIDLAVWLGLDKAAHDQEVVIVTEFSQAVTGFLVSGVTEIHRVGWPEVIPPSKALGRVDTASIVGLVERDGRFIQLLDLEYILADLDPACSTRAWSTSAHAEARYSALVADDSATIRTMLQNNLEAAGFEVLMANNGSEAMDKLQEVKNAAHDSGKPVTDFLDVLISDIEMPLMDGFTLTKSVKNDPVLKTLPVILYSSIITDELRHKGESVGADAQVAKPDLDQMARTAIGLIEAKPAVPAG